MSTISRLEAHATSHTARLLDDFVRSRRYVPEHAHAVRCAEELPLRFRVHAQRCHDGDRWQAWIDQHRIRFVIGRVLPESRREPRETALRVMFYDPEGALAACAVWLHKATGEWALYQVLGPEQVAAYSVADDRRLAAQQAV